MTCLSCSFVGGRGRAKRIKAQTRIIRTQRGPIKKHENSIEVDLALEFPSRLCRVLLFQCSVDLPNFRSSSGLAGSQQHAQQVTRSTPWKEQQTETRYSIQIGRNHCLRTSRSYSCALWPQRCKNQKHPKPLRTHSTAPNTALSGPSNHSATSERS